MSKKVDHIPDILFHTAFGFYNIGFGSAFKLKDVTKDDFLQKISPAAVNFSFSIELLIKGLNLIIAKRKLHGHHLLKLFNQLPQEIRTEIEKRYNFHQKENELNNDLGGYKLKINKTNSDSPKEVNEDNSSFQPIDQVLSIHATSFENWRYLFEIPEEGYSYEVDFKALACIVKALVDVINSNSPKPRLVIKDT